MHPVPASLLENLRQYPTPRAYVVAYSGGCDSHSLLHSLVQIREQLDCQTIKVIHVDHGLQAQASDWTQHCQNICDQYDIPFTAINLSLQVPKGESIEAYARTARYAAFEQHLKDDEMLLLAQHQDDQAETMLLQLLRGSGVKGLAAMPEVIKAKTYWQARPWLTLSRRDIQAYAEQASLNWIDDPSNQDNRFDRNFLRNEVIPVMRQRWPSLSETMSRAAGHQVEANMLLHELADLDWQTCQAQAPDSLLTLAIEPLKKLNIARQRNLLRYWISEKCRFPMPDRVQCQRIIDEILPAAEDAEPFVSWASVAVRRYRDMLYLETVSPVVSADWQQSWDLQSPFKLPSGQQLVVKQKKGRGMIVPDNQEMLTVRFRLGGEKCRLPGRSHRHELKKLLQGWGVPPWQRDQIPLIYIGDEIAQVVGYSICEPFIATSEQIGLEISLVQ